MPRAPLVLLVAGLVWSVCAAARAEASGTARALSSAERRALESGDTVSRSVRFSRGESGRYVGGVAYQLVRASPREVLVALADVNALPRALPHTRSAELLQSSGRQASIELVQGKSPFLVRYTLLLEQVPSGDEIRFWLDPARPHGVRDVWGFFRVQEFEPGRTLLTLAVALDLGPGFARVLFEERVERSILRAPAKIRAFVEPRAVVAGSAP